MVPSITPQELNDRLQDSAPVLLDVREPVEVAHCKLDGSVHIPLSQLRQRVENALEPGQEIVVYCHHGTRSLVAAQLLKSLGYPHVINLTGGIDRWSLEVDPSLPRY